MHEGTGVRRHLTLVGLLLVAGCAGSTGKATTPPPDERGAISITTTELVLDVAKPGRYRFICTFHDQAGMTGSLDVTP